MDSVNTWTMMMMVVALFSLGWFLTGILAGRHLDEPASGGRQTPEKKRRGTRAVEVYVGNLSYDVRERELVNVFKRHGDVLSARIIKNKFNGKSKGFAFVQMADEAQMSVAVRALNGQELKGRRIVVNEAKSKS